MQEKLRAYATDQQWLARAGTGRNLAPQSSSPIGDQVTATFTTGNRLALRPQAKGTLVPGPQQTLVLAAPISAVAISSQQLPASEDPGQQRARIARSMSGIPYKQEEGHLRSASTPDALEYMDCSEFVARVLAAVGITQGVQSLNSGTLLTLLSDTSKFTRSDTPHVGDIALWGSHTGIVGAVGTGNTMKLIHAKGTRKILVNGKKISIPLLSGENSYAITPEQYQTGSYFYGYYRPVAEAKPIPILPARQPLGAPSRTPVQKR